MGQSESEHVTPAHKSQHGSDDVRRMVKNIGSAAEEFADELPQLSAKLATSPQCATTSAISQHPQL